MNKKIFFTAGTLLILLLPFSLAQEASISIEHMGYGKNNREVYVSVRNTGDVRLTNITFYVDGQEYSGGSSAISPGISIIKLIYLKSGQHLIEVKTLEGASDSLTIGTPYIKEKPSVTEEPTDTDDIFSFFDQNKLWISIILVLIIVVVIWLLRRKPRMM